MDNLSSLKRGLPRDSTISGVADLDASLINEFRTAANAVTKLFKLSGAKAVAGRDQGYIDAIEDLLDALEGDPSLNVLEWALQKQKMFHDGGRNDDKKSCDNIQGGSLQTNTNSCRDDILTNNNDNHEENCLHNPGLDQEAVKCDENEGHDDIDSRNMVASLGLCIPNDEFTFESSIAYPTEKLPDEPRGSFELNLTDPIQIENSHKRKFNYLHRNEKRAKRDE